jgi:hypothetical protein
MELNLFSRFSITCTLNGSTEARYSKRLSMAEIIVLWMLGLIVIAIAWGGVDKIAVPIKSLVKALAQSMRTPERKRRFEIASASLFALAGMSIMVATAGNSMRDWVDMPALLVWAGGLWLVPFRFDAVGHYWLSSLAIVVILALFWVGSDSHPSTGAHARTNVLTQQGQDTSTGITGLGFLFWIILIGVAVTAIARYTSTWNAVAFNS